MTHSISASPLTMSDIIGNPVLRAYLSNVRDWHGYIRFLGLPDRRDNPDVLIDRLFVEPLVTRRHVSPDDEPSSWAHEADTIFDVLAIGKPVVLLGDPGSGKSTLLNYLVWLLSRPTADAWSSRMGDWLLPVPMLLRDLSLHGVTTFRELLNAFLRHAMSAPLRRHRYLKEMLDQGRALILLDGIDELGDPTARKHLKKAVYDGFARYPRCRWVLSSRIVGYDEVPFDTAPDLTSLQSARRESRNDSLNKALRSEGEKLPWQPDIFALRATGHAVDRGSVSTRYIAPFNDGRIEAFARNWYVQREAAATRAGEDAEHLVRAVHADDAILRLARVPNLLTMMALIHRIEATLPHGRALLYERIAEAYLESIDRYRGVYSGAYNLPQKRRWLARVGYELQRRRSTNQQSASSSSQTELLADSGDVIAWLNDEMRQGSSSENISAEDFLDFVGRRSGLFLPRGEGRYAFVHLSFQEYFAAVALEREVTGVNWARGQVTALELQHNVLAAWAGQSAWRETFAFLFELLASREDWHAGLLEAVYGDEFARLEDSASGTAVNLAHLLARLVVNPRSGLPRDMGARATAAAVRATLRHQSARESSMGPERSAIFASLLGGESNWNRRVLNDIVTQAQELGVRELSLAQTQVADVRPLAGLTALEFLDLSDTLIADLGPLANLTALTSLDLAHTRVADLTPLANCRAIKALRVNNTQVADLQPLTKLTTLTRLYASQTQVADLGPLANLSALIALVVWGTGVADVSPLADLTALIALDLWGTRVADLGPLAHLTALVSLDLRRTPVANLEPLANLSRLKTLELGQTHVTDLEPLANLSGLRTLELGQTQVTDLAPLANLGGLRTLDLKRTQVANVEPLGSLTALKVLILEETQVTQDTIGELQRALPKCNIVL